MSIGNQVLFTFNDFQLLRQQGINRVKGNMKQCPTVSTMTSSAHAGFAFYLQSDNAVIAPNILIIHCTSQKSNSMTGAPFGGTSAGRCVLFLLIDDQNLRILKTPQKNFAFMLNRSCYYSRHVSCWVMIASEVFTAR